MYVTDRFLRQHISDKSSRRNFEPVKQYRKIFTQWLNELSWNPISLSNLILQNSWECTAASERCSNHMAIGVTILRRTNTIETLNIMAMPVFSPCEYLMWACKSPSMIPVLRMSNRKNGITKVNISLVPRKTRVFQYLSCSVWETTKHPWGSMPAVTIDGQ